VRGMPTLDEYIKSGGFERDKANGANIVNGPGSSSSSSSGSSFGLGKPYTPAPSTPSSSGGSWGLGQPYNPNPSSGSSSSGGLAAGRGPIANGAPVRPATPAVPQLTPEQLQAKLMQEMLAQQAAAKAKAEAEAAAKKQQYINTQTGLYNDYFNTQQNSSLASLRNARETALQSFNNSERVAQQNAYTNKNQVDASHMQTAQRLREIMASQGLLSSGDNVTANLQLENQRANSLNDINQATGNILQDVAEKRNLTNNQAASQEQALIDKISADKTKALIDLQQYGDQKEMQLTQFNYNSTMDAMKQAYLQQQQEIQNKLTESQYTGEYKGQATIDALYKAWQMAQGRLDSDRNYSISTGQLTGNFMPIQAQQAFAQILSLKQAAEAPNVSENEMQQYKAQADSLRNSLVAMGIDPSSVGYDSDYNTASKNLLNARLGIPTLGQKQLDQTAKELKFKEDSYQQTFNEDVRQFDISTAIEKAYKEGQLSIQQAAQAIDRYNAETSRMNAGTSAFNASNSASNAAYNRLFDVWNATGKAPAGIPGVTEGTPLYNKSSAQPKDPLSYINDLNKMYVSEDASGKMKVNNPKALRDAIISLGMDDNSTIKLLSYYQLPIQATSYSGGR
jgi:hypothetical protein